jgi:hypothetical protein
VATSDVTSVLDEAGVSYELLPHAHTESALAEAEPLGVSPDDVAKTLIVKLPSGYTRVVLPASARLDMHKLREIHGGGRHERAWRPRRTSGATIRSSSLEPSHPWAAPGAIPSSSTPRSPPRTRS